MGRFIRLNIRDLLRGYGTGGEPSRCEIRVLEFLKTSRVKLRFQLLQNIRKLCFPLVSTETGFFL